MPTLNETYCFDLRRPLEDGSARVTDWYDITPKALLHTSNRKLYLGKAGYIGEYTGYLDDASQYRMEYYTTWIDFGNPIQTSILKKIKMALIGVINQVIIFKWGYDFVSAQQAQTATVTSSATEAEWGTSEWGIAEWGSIIDVSIINVNGGGSGKVIQFGFEGQINGTEISVQKIDIFTKEGRI